MFVKVIDKKGKERYINPMYVRGLVPKGADETELEMSGLVSNIRVKEAAESVAMTLNDAMPTSLEAEWMAAEQQNQNDQTVATIAVIG